MRQSTIKKLSPREENTRILWVGVFIAILIVAALVFLQTLSSRASVMADVSMPAEVTVNEAAALREQGAFMLDVREVYEWEEFHIPGSTLIPAGELSARLGEIPRDQPIVVVCRSGNRSAAARDVLLNAGFTQVTSMAGGVTDWKRQGFPIVSGP